MERSSHDSYVQSANETRRQVQNTDGTSGGVRPHRGLRTRGGGLKTRREVQISERSERYGNRVRRRSINEAQNSFESISNETENSFESISSEESSKDDDIFDNTYIPCDEEEGEEEGRRGQVRGRGRGHGRRGGRRCGRGRGRGCDRRIGRGRGRRHEEEEVTMVTLRPGIGNSCARNSNEDRHREEEEVARTMVTWMPGNDASYPMNFTGRLGVDNSNERRHMEEEEATTIITSGRIGIDNTTTNSVERHEIGNSDATNCNEGCSSPLPSQIDEIGPESGNSVIIDSTNELKCPVCFKTFNIYIYHCKKGHTACSSCYHKHKRCPYCSMGYTRNLPFEKLYKEIKITCSNSKYGCKEKVSYRMKRDLFEHQRSCTYEPCYCPLPGCGFDGSYKDLYLHFAEKHPASATRFTYDSSFSVDTGADMKYKFLQEDDHTLFVLIYGVMSIGNVAEVICMGPRTLQNGYTYDLEARNPHKFTKSTSLTQSLAKWTVGLPQNPVLVISKNIIESSWDHKIEICIHRKGEN